MIDALSNVIRGSVSRVSRLIICKHVKATFSDVKRVTQLIDLYIVNSIYLFRKRLIIKYTFNK